MHRHGLTRLLSTSATLLLVVGIAPLRAHATSEVEQHLAISTTARPSSSATFIAETA
jgi:hypothetical protein